MVEIVFLFFLYIMAVSDYKTGEIDLRLILLTYVITIALNIWLNPIEYVLMGLISGMLSFFIYLYLWYKKSLGFGDVLIFTLLVVLFLPTIFFIITISACLIGLVLYRKHEVGKQVRFFPYLAFTSTIVLGTKLLFLG